MPLGEFSWQEVGKAVAQAKWEIPLPIVVLGGIYSGYFAISEAAAVTAIYVLIVDVLILKEVSLKDLPQVMRESMVLVGGILVILGMSLASTNYMIDAGVPQQLLAWISGYVDSQLGFLFLLLVFLLMLGAILDIFSAIVLVVPLILPIATQYDIHPVHLGIVFLATMQLGLPDTPVGLNLFHSQLPVRKTDRDNLHGHSAVLLLPVDIYRGHRILATAFPVPDLDRASTSRRLLLFRLHGKDLAVGLY